MWHVSFVAVWQPCELLYTYYLLGYYRTLFLAMHMEQTDRSQQCLSAHMGGEHGELTIQLFKYKTNDKA